MDPIDASTRPGQPQGTPPPGGRSVAPHGHFAWTVLVASLWLTAGHAVLLAVVLSRTYGVPTPLSVGGVLPTVIYYYFLLSVPLAVAALVCRRRLLALRTPVLGVLAAVSAGLGVTAVGLYLAHSAGMIGAS